MSSLPPPCRAHSLVLPPDSRSTGFLDLSEPRPRTRLAPPSVLSPSTVINPLSKTPTLPSLLPTQLSQHGVSLLALSWSCTRPNTSTLRPSTTPGLTFFFLAPPSFSFMQRRHHQPTLLLVRGSCHGPLVLSLGSVRPTFLSSLPLHSLCSLLTLPLPPPPPSPQLGLVDQEAQLRLRHGIQGSPHRAPHPRSALVDVVPPW